MAKIQSEVSSPVQSAQEGSTDKLADDDVSVRCDSCSAAALVWYVKAPTLELAFCGHHANENEPGLLKNDFAILRDRRSSLK